MSKEPATTFSVNLEQLTEMQKGFMEGDHQFIYFRKGEAENNMPVVGFLIVCFIGALNFIKEYPKLREGVKVLREDLVKLARVFLRNRPPDFKPTDFKELASPKKPEITATMELVNVIGGSTQYLAPEMRGRFRYFVNEQRYCLFVRRSDGTFAGVTGDDPEMIASLKDAFESEWEEVRSDQQAVRHATVGIEEAQKWAEQVAQDAAPDKE